MTSNHLSTGKKLFDVIRRRLGFLLFVVTLVVGIGLFVYAVELPKENSSKELLHGIGFALIVAAVVGGIYELQARLFFDSERFSELLSRIVGEFVAPEVWDKVRSQVFESELIRRNTHIHLKLTNSPSLPDGVKLLWMTISYDAYGLKMRSTGCSIVHHLDTHIKYDKFPRFTGISVNGQEQDPDVPHGKFSKKVRLQKRGGEPVPVRTVREEATYVPGSYILSMREITADLHIHLQELPDDLEMSVNIFPDFENEPLEKDVERRFDAFLLPGQAIEFRFKRASDP